MNLTFQPDMPATAAQSTIHNHLASISIAGIETRSEDHTPLEPASESTVQSQSSALDWLSALVGPATHMAIGIRHPDGTKAYFPTIIESEADRLDLIRAHIGGCIPPRRCMRGNETFMCTGAFGVGFYPVQRVEGRYVTRSVVFDVDGPGHADGLVPEDVETVTWGIVQVLNEAGLHASVVRSSGGKGRHVIVTLDQPIEAGLAVFIAEEVTRFVPKASKVEIFPRSGTLREGQLGRLVALPLSGSPTVPGGCCLIDPSGNEQSTSSVRLVPKSALTPFDAAYKMYREAQIKFKNAKRAEGHMYSHISHSQQIHDNGTPATLEQVVRSFAEVVDDRETESDIIAIRCPTHGGSCFHVNPDEGWFYCHKCLHRGGGPSAPYFLLRLLRPTWSAKDVRDELHCLAKANTQGAKS